MNALPLLLLASLTATPEATTVYSPSDRFLTVLRGQSPGVDFLPDSNGPQPFVPDAGAPPMNAAPPQQPYFSNPAPGFPQPYTGDPFLQPPGASQYQVPVNPYGGPNWSFGANGPQPYRYGWTTRADYTVMPNASSTQGLGAIGFDAIDFEAEYTTPMGPAWIYSFTQELDFRWWDGPTSSRSGPPLLRDAGFSEQYYRVGWDFEVATPGNGPWSYQFGFNPSINTDLQQSISRDAWNFDGRAIVFYRPNSQWTFAFGAGYWDRVTDRVIPYAGAIYTPDDRWEFRIVFPEPRISYFLGTPSGVPTWLYVRGEYHVEAYQTELVYGPHGSVSRQEKMELSDWRVMLGLRKEHGSVSSFIEGGIVFDRQVEFLHGTPGFDINSGFIGRIGIRY